MSKFYTVTCAVAIIAFCTSCAEKATHNEADVSDFWNDNVTAQECFDKQQSLLTEYGAAVAADNQKAADSLNLYGKTLASKIDEKCKTDKAFKKAYDEIQQATIGKDAAKCANVPDAQ